MKCDMSKECPNKIAYIDEKGFIYCESHGKIRKMYCRCRKLKPKELKTLQNEKPLERF